MLDLNTSNETDEIIELEQDNKDEVVTPLMKKPFDPALINIDTKTPSLDTLIKRISHNEILLDTETYFQRQPNLWNDIQQSSLIESILIRFPLPAFYFDGSNKDKWLVVDGLQRLSSIRNFVLNKTTPLRLTKLEFLTQLEGKTFDELGRDLQRIIEETTVVVYIINPGTPIDVKFNIFKRINTGGLVLKPQEIRHALFQGTPAQFIKELAELPEFEEATTGSLKQDHRMLDRDFANRFLCFYLFGYENYEPDLDDFMSKAMAAISDFTEEQKNKIKADYSASLKLSQIVFGDRAFRKIDPFSLNKKPINKALFDVFTVQFGLLSAEERTIVANKKEMVSQKFVALLQQNDLFFWSVTSATGDKNRVITRHSTIKNMLKEIIKEYHDTVN